MNDIEAQNKNQIKRRLYVNFKAESDQVEYTPKKSAVSWPKALRKIQSVYVNNALRENSFSKILKKKVIKFRNLLNHIKPVWLL